MPNPPSIAFTIPYSPVSVGFVVNANGVQPDGTNVPVPDTTSPLVIGNFVGGSYVSASVDPSNNRRVIVSAVAPPPAANSVAQWSFTVTVTGKPGTVTVSGTTKSPTDISGVFWDGVNPA